MRAASAHRVIAGLVDAGRDQWVTEFTDDGQGNTVIRNPDTNSLLLGGQQVWDLAGCFKDKGIGPGQVAFEDLVGEVTNLAVTGNVGDIGTDESQ